MEGLFHDILFKEMMQMVTLKQWGVLIVCGVMFGAIALINVKSRLTETPSLEGWRHAERVADSSLVDKIAVYERDGECRQLLVGWSGVTFVNDWFTLTRRNPTEMVRNVNIGMDSNIQRGWDYTSTQFNRELVDELNHGSATQRLWFVNANTIGIIGELEAAEGDKAAIRFLDLHSGFTQTVNLDEKLGLLDLGVIHISPWNGLIAIASDNDKTVWISKVRRRDDGRWQVVSFNLIDDTRRQITALTISPDGKVVYCFDVADESVILRWRIGKSIAWELVGGGYPTEGKYVGNIAVDRQGDIACVRDVDEDICGGGVYLDRYNSVGERKRRLFSENGDIDQAFVSFTRNGTGACVLVRHLADDSRIYSLNFLGSTSFRKATNSSELVSGQNAYILCHNVAPNDNGRRGRDVLYEITP